MQQLEILTRCRHSRRHSDEIENVHHASRLSPKKGRRRTINCGPTRPSLSSLSETTQQVARMVPQRIVNPRSIPTKVQSIWFQSPIEHPDFGVSLASVVDDGVLVPMVAPEERVFQRFGLNCEEIEFSILVSGQPSALVHLFIRVIQWPGYGHISWIASIPINLREGSGYQCGPITRRLLASAVAQHFQAFMTVSLFYVNTLTASSAHFP